MKYQLHFLFCVFLFQQIFANEIDYSLEASLRTKPVGGSLTGNMSFNHTLWDNRTNKEDLQQWQYGKVQIEFELASYGLLSAGLNLFPVSFVQLSYARSLTSRYYENSLYNCNLAICKGNLYREISMLRLYLPTGFTDIYAIPSVKRITLTHSDNSLPLIDEIENISLNNGQDTENVYELVIGKQIEKDFLGVWLKQTTVAISKTGNESQYLIYKVTKNNLSYKYGLGRYASSVVVPDVSALFAIEWKN